jgi:hypothetical protein
MATDDDRQYTTENPRPAHEDLSPTVLEFIYGKPDEMPELEWPDEDERDPFIHGGRVGVEDDE